MNKKKLLITMGCSLTEGYGCFDTSTFDYIPEKPLVEYNKFYEIIIKNKPNFHVNSWPYRLQRKIKYDTLINLGKGGSSTSGQLKSFIEKYFYKDFSDEYDVLVIWALPESSRISFYRNGKNIDIITSMLEEKRKWRNFEEVYFDLGESYVSFMGDTLLDPMLEQSFYVKCMSLICSQKKYQFLFTTFGGIGDTDYKKNIISLYPNEGNLYLKQKRNLFPNFIENPNMKSLVCGHPNDIGYEYVSDVIFETIKNEYSYLMNNSEPGMYESIYNGDYIQHTKNLI
jgi:hypothetical protein